MFYEFQVTANVHELGNSKTEETKSFPRSIYCMAHLWIGEYNRLLSTQEIKRNP
jgi:hypothetical protein